MALNSILTNTKITRTLFSYLSFSDRLSATATSKSWRSIFVPLLWAELTEDHYSLVQFERLVSKYGQHIESFYVLDPDNELTASEADETVDLCPNLHTLIIDDMRRSSMVKRLVTRTVEQRGAQITRITLKHLIFEGENAKSRNRNIDAIINSISKLPNLKRLDIDNVEMPAQKLEKLISELKTEKLVALTVDIDEPATRKTVETALDRYGSQLVLLSIDKITDDIAAALNDRWNKLVALETLRLAFFLNESQNAFAKLSAADLPNLRMLSVREDTNDEQLRSLWSHPWPRVTRLEADCLWIEDTAAHAISTQAPALRELRMTYPTFISPEGLSMILEAHLAQLHELHLVGPGVDLASIWQSSWPQPLALRDVMLSVAHVSAEILTSVLASAKLTGLDLDAAMLDDPVAIWDDILEHRAKLEAIGLANITMLDDAAVDKVLALWKDSLRWIDLEKTHVSPAKIAEIAATYENIDVGTGEADQLDNDDDDYEDFSD